MKTFRNYIVLLLWLGDSPGYAVETAGFPAC